MLTARGLDARREGDTAFQRLDAHLAWTHRDATVYLDATNIGDSHPTDVSGRPAAGRALSLGLRLTR